MPQHRVDMSFPKKPIDIGKSDVRMAVYSNDSKLGELGISKGGVTWWPVNRTYPSKDITWEQFAKLMEG